MIRSILPLAACLALGACATVPAIGWAPAADFVLVAVDNPIGHRFDLTLTSNAKRALCLSQDAWPAEGGMPLGFDGAQLDTRSGRKELSSTGNGYCPGGCGDVRIEPGQTLRGVLPYQAFGDEASVANDAGRMLHFDVHPYLCRR